LKICLEVMLNGNFPVESGLVVSLARPGGNVTGTSYYSSELVGKQLQILKEVVPSAIRVAILWESSAPRDKGFGLTIPQAILLRADRVIE